MGMENKLLLSFENCDHTPPRSSHLEIKQLQFFWSFIVGHVFKPSDHSRCSLLLSPVIDIILEMWCQKQGAALMADALIVLNKAEGFLHLSHRAISCYTPNYDVCLFPCGMTLLIHIACPVLEVRFSAERPPYHSGPSLVSVCPPCICHVWAGTLPILFLRCASSSVESTQKTFGLLF